MDIAVIVSGGVTETLQATPLMRSLRAGLPASRLRLWCPASAAAAAECIPPVDEVHPLPELGGTRSGGSRLWAQLRGARLDAAMVCAGGQAAAAAAYFAGIPRRLGTRGGLRSLVLNGRVTPGPGENVALTWLRLAALLGVRQQLHAPTFEPGPQARRHAEQLVHGTGLGDGRLLVALVPGTGLAELDAAPTASTAWDPECWAHLANQLVVRHGAGILLLGSPHDRPAVERAKVDLHAGASDLVGEADLPTLAGILARCDLLVAGDTPLLHLAAAMGTPTVGLFGPTDGARRGAYGGDHRVVQALAAHAPNGIAADDGSPMARIRVEDVLAGIEASI